jgi:tetratricopeptide (TPR) repeat protein
MRLITALLWLLRRLDTQTTGALYELHALALELAHRGGWHHREVTALLDLGDLYAAADQHRQALDYYRAALKPGRGVADGAAIGRALEAVAGAYRELGDLERTADWYGRALALRRSRGELVEQARLLSQIGMVHTDLQLWAEAPRGYRAAAAIHRRLGDEEARARVLLETASVYELAGEVEESLRMCREALVHVRRLGDRSLEVVALTRMADTLERAGDRDGARLQRDQATGLRSDRFPSSDVNVSP